MFTRPLRLKIAQKTHDMAFGPKNLKIRFLRALESLKPVGGAFKALGRQDLSEALQAFDVGRVACANGSYLSPRFSLGMR